MSYTDSDQGDNTQLQLAHRSRLHPLPIKWCDPAPEDRYAPAPHCFRCKDAAGYRRQSHDWDGDGRCYFCSKQRTWAVD